MKSVVSIPNFHSFIVHQIGDPRHLPRFCWNWFAKPLSAKSFAGFWRMWNPVYGYVLLFFVYRPIRPYLPRFAATFLTFCVSGFVLHEIPFGVGIELLRGHRVIPEATILLGVFGVLMVLTEAVGMDFSAYPIWVRVAANIGLLALGFLLRRVIISLL